MDKLPKYFPFNERQKAEDYFYEQVSKNPKYIGWFELPECGYYVQFVPVLRKEFIVLKIHGVM